MYYDNIWAFSAERITEYFLAVGASGSDGRYFLDGCGIVLTKMEDRFVGQLKIAQTKVIIDGENASAVYEKFRLNFLSGGA